MTDARRVKVRLVTLVVVDHDDVGAAGVAEVLENARYPNRCISPRVVEVESREVDWTDEHPLNQRDGWRNALADLFGD